MSLTYLLDTNICIYITKQKPISVLHRFEKLTVGMVAMSAITYGELCYGSEKSTKPKQAHHTLETLTGIIPSLPIPTEAAKYYGHIRYYLAKKGKIIGNNDLWIAAHAMALDIILVTNNIKEFQRVPKLKIENWVS